jgi:triosephosphate isomerase
LDIDIVISPSSIFIQQVSILADKTNLQIAAQNCHFANNGAYTGEISPQMVQEFGCKYVILGHSERRLLFAETNELIAKKFNAAYGVGLKPILCIGEKLEEKEKGQTLQVLDRQLNEVINLVGAQVFAEAIIAYEPVWAIGTGVSATPIQAESVHNYIREKLAKHSNDVAKQAKILYGGSVTEKNSEELFNQPNIDGVLIGGASLKAKEFVAICRYATKKVTA